MNSLRTVLAAGLAVATVLCSSTVARAQSLADDRPGSCTDVQIDVALHEGAAATERVAATWCVPDSWAPGPRRTDVLVAGATYNRQYWDWPQDRARYSYVDMTLRAGRATFSFDRLGTGGSSKPNALTQTADTDAFVLHQLIEWVKRRQPTEITAIGHSLGSIVVNMAQARWHDADRIVVTGILHLPGVGLNAAGFATSLYPAALDPQFALTPNGQPGYITTIPGRRGPNFYDPTTVEPAVITYDEAHKDVATAGEIQAILELETPAVLNRTRQITEPVLVVMGETDNIFCNLTVDCRSARSIKNNEARYYSAASRLDVVTVPRTAHNLTLHPSAPTSFQMINDWMMAGHRAR